MAIEGFDFTLLPEGEIVMDPDDHDIETVETDKLKVQLAYNRIKSITSDWFVDNIGADLEELVGCPCTYTNVEYGKIKILSALGVDELWKENDIHITSQVKDNVHIAYTVHLKLYKDEEQAPFDLALNDPYAYELTAELDLIKGVFIRMGWNPRAKWRQGIAYTTSLTSHRKDGKS